MGLRNRDIGGIRFPPELRRRINDVSRIGLSRRVAGTAAAASDDFDA